MRDQDNGSALFPGKAQEQLHHLAGGLGIQVAGGFVGKYHLGIGDKGAGDAHALLLAAAHFVGTVAQALAQPHLPQHLAGGLLPLFAGDPPEHQRHGHVFHGGHSLHQVVGLEHKADVPLPEQRQLFFAHFGDFLPPDPYRAAGRLFQSGQLVQQGGFPAAGGAQDTADLPFFDGKVDLIQRHDLFIADTVYLAETDRLHHILHSISSSHRCSFLSVVPFAVFAARLGKNSVFWRKNCTIGISTASIPFSPCQVNVRQREFMKY